MRGCSLVKSSTTLIQGLKKEVLYTAISMKKLSKCGCMNIEPERLSPCPQVHPCRSWAEPALVLKRHSTYTAPLHNWWLKVHISVQDELQQKYKGTRKSTHQQANFGHI